MRVTVIRLLITGSNGFLGRSLMRAAVKELGCGAVLGCDVSGGMRVGETLLNVRDGAACMSLMKSFKPTHVLHAAAVTSGTSDDEMRAVNVAGARNIVEAAIAARSVERLVMLSSSGVYGAALTGVPCDEEHPLDLRRSYSATKREAEMLLPPAEARSGVEMAAARVGPCYGPGEGLSAFRPQRSLIGRLSEALRQGSCVRVYGEAYSRDWTYVEDVFTALYGLLTTAALKHRLYNVSSGVAAGTDEIFSRFAELGLQVDRVQTAAEADVILRAQDGRKAMVIDRLREDTGFVPAVSLGDGIASLSEVTLARA